MMHVLLFITSGLTVVSALPASASTSSDATRKEPKPDGPGVVGKVAALISVGTLGVAGGKVWGYHEGQRGVQDAVREARDSERTRLNGRVDKAGREAIAEYQKQRIQEERNGQVDYHQRSECIRRIWVPFEERSYETNSVNDQRFMEHVEILGKTCDQLYRKGSTPDGKPIYRMPKEMQPHPNAYARPEPERREPSPNQPSAFSLPKVDVGKGMTYLASQADAAVQHVRSGKLAMPPIKMKMNPVKFKPVMVA